MGLGVCPACAEIEETNEERHREDKYSLNSVYHIIKSLYDISRPNHSHQLVFRALCQCSWSTQNRHKRNPFQLLHALPSLLACKRFLPSPSPPLFGKKLKKKQSSLSLSICYISTHLPSPNLISIHFRNHQNHGVYASLISVAHFLHHQPPQ
jgi:hypothetical protein